MRIVFMACCLAAASPVFGQAQPTAKKIIEWGWDEPDTAFMRKNIEKMEQYPFDGLVFHVVSDKGDNLVWEMWGSRRFALAQFQHAIDDLNATRFQHLTDRFLRVNVTPGNVDWFHDDAWSVVLNNYGIAAQIARQGGCRGFMFDVEQYNEGLFDYATQPLRDTQSFADYQAKVRQRGREWMQQVSREFPDITILITFGYRIAQPREGQEKSQSHYALLANFLDGVLESCPPTARLVDAWEFSYPYKQEQQFREAYDTIKSKSLAWTGEPEKYRRQFQAGFGLWMDCAWRQVGWNTDDFSKNHFTPEQFAAALRAALDTSDEYVWIYTEQPRWWTAEKLPDEYVDAVKRARGGAKDASR